MARQSIGVVMTYGLEFMILRISLVANSLSYISAANNDRVSRRKIPRKIDLGFLGAKIESR